MNKNLVKFWKFVLHDFEHSSPLCKYEVYLKFENIIRLNECINILIHSKLRSVKINVFFFSTHFIIFGRKKLDFFFEFLFLNVNSNIFANNILVIN
jgi:hypothetical protein